MPSVRKIAALALFSVGLSAGVAAMVVGIPAYTQEDQQGVLAGLISKVLSTPTSTVRIGSVEGALSSEATIHDVRISDADGEWLVLDQARLEWSRLSLLRGRLQVNELDISGLSISRRPLPSEAELPADTDTPILPELPVKVVIETFTLTGLQLGEPILGTAARLSATGSAELGDPSEGLQFDFSAQRNDAPGTFAVKLSYVPSTEQFDLAVDLREPEGGLVAHALDIPGTPPVTLDIAGSGPLDNWAAGLKFDAGPEIGADGKAVLARSGPVRRLNLDLAARIAGLVPEPVMPIVNNTTQLAGSAVFGDDGGYAIEEFSITSEVARLAVRGYITAGRDLDLDLTARAIPAADGSTRAGQAEIANLVLDAKLTGPMAAPRLNGTLEAANVRTPEGSLESLVAQVRMDPVAGTSRFNLDASAQARGLALTDPARARAFGDRLDFTARGVLDEERILQLDNAHLAVPTASADLNGRFGAEVVDAHGRLSVADLSTFSGVAGSTLDGKADFALRLTGNPKRSVDASLDGQLSDFVAGVPAVDGLFGKTVSLAGTLRQVRGGFEARDLRLHGANLDATLQGRATQTAADMTLTAEISDLRHADQALTGRATLDARLTGSLRAPDVIADLALRDGSALGRPVPQLILRIEGTDLTGALAAHVSLDGEIGSKPAKGNVRLTRLGTPEAPGWNLDDLDVSIGSVVAAGAVHIGTDRMASGRLTIDAGDLDDMSPLLLTLISGRLNAALILDATDGLQNAQVSATGEGLAFAGNSLQALRADVRIADAYVRPRIEGEASASGIAAGGQHFDTLRLDAQQTATASELTLAATGGGFDLSGRAALVPDAPVHLDLESFSARRGKRQVALAAPARLTFPNGAVEFSNLTVAVDGGRVDISGRAGHDLDLTIAVKDVPLSAADIAVPGLGLSGTLDGHAELKGPAAMPAGSYRVAVRQLRIPQAQNTGLPPVDIRGEGRFADGRASVDGNVAAGRAGSLTISGTAPMAAAGSLDLRARGSIDAAVANTVLGASGQRLTGSTTLDMHAGGSAAAPLLDGSIVFANGSFTDEANGVKLTGISARVQAHGDRVSIERLSAMTPANGRLSASGSVRIDPAAGFPVDVRITGERAQLVSSDVVTAVADLDLAVSGAAVRNPRISGQVDLISMDVTVPDRLPATRQPLPETRHVGATGAAARRIAARKRETAAAGPPFDAGIDLVLNAPNRIFVRGRGINAELGGNLRLTGTTGQPNAIGGFELRRGRLDVIGQRIDLSRGRLTFAGDLAPELDFIAETSAGDVTAQVAVTGNAAAPEFAFTSIPELPQDEVLSRLLFGKASGGLSATQALQLAQAVAQFSGGGSGPGVFEAMRRSLGVDSLDIGAGANGNVSVGASRYINDRVSVGVKAGAQPEDAGVTINLDVTRHLKLQGAAGADGSASGGIGIEREY